MVDIQPLRVRSCMMYGTCVWIKHSSSARGWSDHAQHTIHRPIHTPACSEQVWGDDASFEGKRCNRILKISCKGPDGKDRSRQFSQEVNPNTYQHTMPSRHFRPAISSTPHPPLRHLVIINSKTKSKSEDPYPNDDKESMSIIENQAGLPESQHGIIKSSPSPPASNVNHDVSNNNGEFFLKERCIRTEFSVSRSSLQNSSQCGWRKHFWGDEYWHCIVIGQQGEKKFIIIIMILTYKIFRKQQRWKFTLKAHTIPIRPSM